MSSTTRFPAADGLIPQGIRLSGSSRPATTYAPDTAPCARCGILRFVRSGRGNDLCRDCTEVERDLQRPPAIDDRCGTAAGVYQHKKRGEQNCIDCAIHAAAVRMEWYRMNGREKAS